MNEFKLEKKDVRVGVLIWCTENDWSFPAIIHSLSADNATFSIRRLMPPIRVWGNRRFNVDSNSASSSATLEVVRQSMRLATESEVAVYLDKEDAKLATSVEVYESELKSSKAALARFRKVRKNFPQLQYRMRT